MCFGQLVQWDTSDHDWLEGRGPVRYLVRMIDDATSWSWGRFVERDTAPFNMAVLWEYIEKNGRMVDVYTDRHSMFTVSRQMGERWEGKPERQATNRLTQPGTVSLRSWESAHFWPTQPQAKGRVERSHADGADRQVRRMRLTRVCTLEDANAFLEKEYWPEWNECFARPVAGFPNQHRPLGGEARVRSRRPILCRCRGSRHRQRLHIFLPRTSIIRSSGNRYKRE